jgi:hypothetical protein
MTTTGLVKYDAMCPAIAVCSRVDEAKDIRDKARAIEVYAKQAQNREAERKAAEIRIRAERRAGQLLKEMKENGQRENNHGGDRKSRSRSSTMKTTLADIGVSKDQSSQWQRLAEIPEKDFEDEIRRSGGPPCTEGILNAKTLKELPKRQMDPKALWVWGRIKDFERSAG